MIQKLKSKISLFAEQLHALWLIKSDSGRNKLINRIYQSQLVLDENIKIFRGGITMMVNNICNANCVFCAYQFNIDPKSTMSLDLFKRGLDSAMKTGYVGTVVLTPVAGEPLADPTLFEKIDYARSIGVKLIMFSTNGSLLSKNDNYKKIIDKKVDFVWLSVPRLTDESYQKVYRTKAFPQVIKGLEQLFLYKQQTGSNTGLRLCMRLDVPEDVAMQDEPMLNFKSYIDSGVVEFEPLLQYDNWSGHIKQEDLVGIMKLKSVEYSTHRVPCSRMVDDLAILQDGSVRICSCRYRETNFDELVIGNIQKNEMSEIHWNDKHKQILKNAAQGNWPKVCHNCSLYTHVQHSDIEIIKLHKKAANCLE